MIKIIKNKKFLIILFIVLIISNVFFAYKYLYECKKIKEINLRQETNKDILAFTLLFMNKVLQNSQEISFDDRLQLETSVRSLNDADIYDSWKNFTKATNSSDVQKNFYNLFTVLLKKIES